MSDLIIDPEFQSLLPPLSDEEFKHLEENIKADGCRDSLKVWNGIIIDGHQRFKICQENNIPFKTEQMDFADRDDAIVWIIQNQLGRKNLSPEESGGLSPEIKANIGKGMPMILKIKDVKIGQRVRDEYGDMQALADSIREHGLLHPIVVDSDYNLIAGCRRLLACERIGLKEIEAKVLEDISEKELRVLELEENIRRKDLTELEKSKNLVELAEIKEQELKEKVRVFTDSVKTNEETNCAESAHLNNPDGREFLADSARNPVGRPQKATSLEKVAAEIGISRETLRDAKQHVKAVEEFPPLENLPKYQAIETAKELRKAPPEEQEKILDFASRRSQLPEVQKEEDFYSYIDECGKIAKKYHKALYAFLEINADEKEFKMLGEAIIPQTAESYLREIEDTINKLSRVRKFMKGVIEHGKNPKIGT
ncbi:ParB N-terminal domain-containing protein [Hungatella effluvii]|jgi:ParB-like chromosome segregation protein Spo0J|uniref:ParB N-terminal domain-containing protein n=1 Tax=Hungatella effluvii TaxID=1096246 RepID=UPI002068C390|nr:ParB N-terminal domain-containing protein [Hungatella effluvii]DAY91511.1 MAG TPA: chromosome partitioning protein [Caudoviricetes sp.]